MLFSLNIVGGGIGAICSTTQSGSCLTVNSECVTVGNQNRCSCIQGYEYTQATETCDLRKISLTLLVKFQGMG